MATLRRGFGGRDLHEGRNVTVIQVTAGIPSSWPCWEKGQFASVITAIKGPPVKLSCGPKQDGYWAKGCAQVTVRGHPIQRCGYKNGTIYFLRVPATWCLGCTNNPQGPGCVHNQNDQLLGFDCKNHTLIQLYRALAPPPFESLGDHPSIYKDFNDLTDTVGNILITSRAASILTFNPRGAKREGHFDHLDHAVVGCLSLSVAKSLGFPVSQSFFSGYDSDRFGENPPEAYQIKEVLFRGAFAATVMPDPTLQPSDPQYDLWMKRTYFEQEEYRKSFAGIEHVVDPFLSDIRFACDELRK